MSWFGWKCGLAMAWIVLAQVPGRASADPVVLHNPLFRLDLTWTASLLPAASAPADAPEPPPLLRFDGVRNPLFSLDAPSPGLQFTFNPDNEEVFFGWQIGF